VGVQVKLCDPLTTRAMYEHFCGELPHESINVKNVQIKIKNVKKRKKRDKNKKRL